VSDANRRQSRTRTRSLTQWKRRRGRRGGGATRFPLLARPTTGENVCVCVRVRACASCCPNEDRPRGPAGDIGFRVSCAVTVGRPGTVFIESGTRSPWWTRLHDRRGLRAREVPRNRAAQYASRLRRRLRSDYHRAGYARARPPDPNGPHSIEILRDIEFPRFVLVFAFPFRSVSRHGGRLTTTWLPRGRHSRKNGSKHAARRSRTGLLDRLTCPVDQSVVTNRYIPTLLARIRGGVKLGYVCVYLRDQNTISRGPTCVIWRYCKISSGINSCWQMFSPQIDWKCLNLCVCIILRLYKR